MLKISVNDSVWRYVFLCNDNKKGVTFLEVEKLASPFSSAFTGKYFFSADIGSGFGAEEKPKVNTFFFLIILKHKDNYTTKKQRLI